jgi:archaemetzincin
MGEPRPGDWMSAHPEQPQSFDTYVGSTPVRPTLARHTIVIVPLGPMTDKDRQQLFVLREFMEIYFTLPVRIGPAVELTDVKSRQRPINGRLVRQYLSSDVLRMKLPPLLPADALCLQAVTMEDLYPEEAWNYVFGQALLQARVGVYSLVRFYPAFWDQPDTPEARQLALARSLKVLVHETGHMFGVWHCQKYYCNMNGSNNLPESDRAPIHLCPDCLKKFRWNIGFDPILRYEALEKFYKAHAMPDEAAWVAKRLEQCRAPAAKTKESPANGTSSPK